MLKINKQTITLTKGDDASLRLVPRYKDRTEYVLTEGDSAVFRIKFGHTLVELECTLNLETNKIVANITPNDTKDFNPGIYRYEAELITSYGFHYTFIADQTFILGQEYEQRITSTSNGNSSAIGGNLPEIDGVVDGEPVVYGDIQPTNPMMDYDELNHLPKLNNKTIKGDHDSEYYGIATKTSELENDSDFVSDDDYVHTDNNYDDTAKNAVDALGTASTYDVPESGNASTSQVVKGDDTRLTDSRNPNPHTHSKADITDFPTNVSAFNNDSGFITNTVNNLANYYLKSETYTRAEVEQLIAAIKQGKFEIVAELPASGDANVIYLVPKSTAQTSNSYDEYVYINNAWEKIGDTDIDLSGYVTDDELTTALQSYLTTSAFNTAIASYYTKTETDNLLANKVDKVAGKGLSTNDYDNTAKGIVDGVTSALNDKVDKVQGKGLSTNDYDNTAKGIVDGVTSALADKVDKVNGKGLSTEDYTTAEKSKLADISENAKKVASSTTNGHIEIDDVDTTVYDDTAVTTAIENIEDELSTDSATVEGNPINFSTLSAQTAESTIIDLEPIQDLHGYDYPWVGGAGKNLIPMTVDKIKAVNTGGTWNGNVYTWRGVTYTIITDSDNNVIGISSNGTANGGAANFALVQNMGVSAGTDYILSGCPTGGATSTYSLAIQNANGDWIGADYDIGSGSTINKGVTTLVISVNNGVNVSNKTWYPMLRLATITDSSFAPYTNICPITGRTQVGAKGCGKNLLPMTVDGIKVANGGVNTWTNNEKVIGGITFDIITNNNGEVTELFAKSGTATSTFTVPFSGFMNVGNYIISTNIHNDYQTMPTTRIVYKRADNSTAYDLFNAITSEKSCLTQFVTFAVEAYFPNGYTIPSGGLSFKPLVRSSSDLINTFEPYQSSNNLTISFGQTVYGCRHDVENGALVVKDKIEDLGNLTFTHYNASGTSSESTPERFASRVLDMKPGGYSISSHYRTIKLSPTVGDGDCYISTASGYVTVVDLKYGSDTSTFEQAMNGVQLCYELATPITINLTPNTINLLKGVNNISTDGDKITLTYRDGSVATLEDVKLASENLEQQIEDAQILTDTVTGDKYKLVITNGVLDIQQISN